jgi:hypothetical protein
MQLHIRFLFFKCLLVLYLFFANLIIKAQQVPQYSQMALRPALFNPAAVSNAHAISLEGLLRGQWTGVLANCYGQYALARN